MRWRGLSPSWRLGLEEDLRTMTPAGWQRRAWTLVGAVAVFVFASAVWAAEEPKRGGTAIVVIGEVLGDRARRPDLYLSPRHRELERWQAGDVGRREVHAARGQLQVRLEVRRPRQGDQGD